jgi:hypothetical protein
MVARARTATNERMLNLLKEISGSLLLLIDLDIKRTDSFLRSQAAFELPGGWRAKRLKAPETGLLAQSKNNEKKCFKSGINVVENSKVVKVMEKMTQENQKTKSCGVLEDHVGGTVVAPDAPVSTKRSKIVVATPREN